MSQTVFPLDQYGAVGTVADAHLAFDKAVQAAQSAGGGTVEISLETAAGFVVRSSPPGVFVSDLRKGIAYLNTPAETRPVSGSDYAPEAGLIIRGSHEAPGSHLYGSPLVEAVHLDRDPDTGAQLLYVRTVRWGTVFGAPFPLVDGARNFYNYGKRELTYIIAPGAVVCDVRDGVAENDNMITGRQLVVQPNGDFGKPGLPFGAADEVGQALGPQPWNPTGFRVRHYTNIPSCIADASFLAQNIGTAAVNYGLLLSGFDDAQKQYRGNPVAFATGMFFGAVTGCGIDFDHDIKVASADQVVFRGVGVPDAGCAVVMRQGGTKNRKVIAWTTRNGGYWATIGFDPDTNAYRLAGGSQVDLTGARLTGATGLSATTTGAENLRGIGIPVAAGAHNLRIAFPTAEPDARYALFVTPSWTTQTAVSAKSTAGFTIDFGQPPAAAATIDWLLVR